MKGYEIGPGLELAIDMGRRPLLRSRIIFFVGELCSVFYLVITFVPNSNVYKQFS